jgi:Fe-S cluster assembly protein SufD
MKITTLTKSPTQPIRITQPGVFCYLLLNHDFHGTFSLEKEGAEVFVLGLFNTDKNNQVHIDQKHLAPHTHSHVVLRSLLQGKAHFSYQGKISIAKEAVGSNASQEARGLLLSPEARFQAVPALEILPNDVMCRHQATASPLSKDSLYFLALRGLNKSEASSLLQNAFLVSATDSLADAGLSAGMVLAFQEELAIHLLKPKEIYA